MYVARSVLVLQESKATAVKNMVMYFMFSWSVALLFSLAYKDKEKVRQQKKYQKFNYLHPLRRIPV